MNRRLVAAAVALVAGGCYQPSVGDCQYTCAASEACPSGLECHAGMCRAPGAGGSCDGVDAAAPDSIDVDGANPDAGGPDASGVDAAVDARTDATTDAATDAAPPPPVWSKRSAGDSHEFARGHSLRRSNDGDLVMVGRTASSSLSFPGVPAMSSLGSYDGFIVKLSPTGAHRWSRRIGGTGLDLAHAVAMDADDNVIVVGSYSGTVNLGGAALPVAGDGNLEMFVLKLSPQGTHIWSTGIATSGANEAFGVAVDTSGDVLVTGSIGWNPFAADAGDITLHKLSGSTGAVIWSKPFTTTNGDAGFGVAADASGDVYLVGQFGNGSGGMIDLGGATLTSTGVSAGFVAKLDGGTGAHVWSRMIQNSNQSDLDAVVVAGGAVMVCGASRGAATLAGGAAVMVGGEYDVFVARLSASDGSHVWSHSHGGAPSDSCFDIGFDGTGGVAVAGAIGSSASFGGAALPFAGSADIVVARYAIGNGAHLGSRSFGGTGDEAGYGVSADPVTGNIHLAGHSSGATDFGDGLAADPLGGYGFFVANIGALP